MTRAALALALRPWLWWKERLRREYLRGWNHGYYAQSLPHHPNCRCELPDAPLHLTEADLRSHRAATRVLMHMVRRFARRAEPPILLALLLLAAPCEARCRIADWLDGGD